MNSALFIIITLSLASAVPWLSQSISQADRRLTTSGSDLASGVGSNISETEIHPI